MPHCCLARVTESLRTVTNFVFYLPRISVEDERDQVVIGVRKRSDFESRDRVRDTNRIDETNKLLQRVLELDS